MFPLERKFYYIVMWFAEIIVKRLGTNLWGGQFMRTEKIVTLHMTHCLQKIRVRPMLGMLIPGYVESRDPNRQSRVPTGTRKGRNRRTYGE